MKRNDILKVKDDVFRVLDVEGDNVCFIDCHKRTMPKTESQSFFDNAELLDSFHADYPAWEDLSPSDRKVAQERYTMIAGAVAVVNDQRQRNMMIDIAAARFEMSKQSIRSFLCTYLAFQDIAALAPRPTKEKELTKDQKNMRWALNKFFYSGVHLSHRRSRFGRLR